VRHGQLVGRATINGIQAYYCEECLLAYKSEDLAKRCQAHCEEFYSCDLILGRQAIGAVEPEGEDGT
jgi:hypothetical protein